jgi:Excalibur calcium-binding domain
MHSHLPMIKKIADWRRKKSTRLLIILFLLLICGLIALAFEKTRWIMLGAAVILLTALGLEVSNTDIDLGKLMQTGSLSKSMIERTADGNLAIGIVCDEGNVYNCSSFANQAEAQEVFEACNWEGNDIHGLDKDNNGIACQSFTYSN